MFLKNMNSKNVKLCVKLEMMKLKYRKISITSLIMATEDKNMSNSKRDGEWGGKKSRKHFF